MVNMIDHINEIRRLLDKIDQIPPKIKEEDTLEEVIFESSVRTKGNPKLMSQAVLTFVERKIDGCPTRWTIDSGLIQKKEDYLISKSELKKALGIE